MSTSDPTVYWLLRQKPASGVAGFPEYPLAKEVVTCRDCECLLVKETAQKVLVGILLYHSPRTEIHRYYCGRCKPPYDVIKIYGKSSLSRDQYFYSAVAEHNKRVNEDGSDWKPEEE